VLSAATSTASCSTGYRWLENGISKAIVAGDAVAMPLRLGDGTGLSRCGGGANVFIVDAGRGGGGRSGFLPCKRGKSSLIISSNMRIRGLLSIRARICGSFSRIVAAAVSDIRVGGLLGRSTSGISLARSSKTSLRQSALGHRSVMMARILLQALRASETSGES
jgi:hypothetical protein